MPTIVIEQAEVRFTLEQLLAVLRQLTPEERELVRRELTPEDWQGRLDQLLTRVRARVEQSPMSERELTDEVESARDAFYRESGD